MKKPLIAGNWKMNKTPSEAKTLIEALLPIAKQSNVDVIVAPSFVSLPVVSALAKDSNIKVAAQNMATAESGAYTGETSVLMLKDLGVSAVIIAHSERRQYYGETNEIANKKIALALQHHLMPIYCVGETLEEREGGKFLALVEHQVREGLKGISAQDMAKVVIAYEPVWAIGTGKVASGEQAEEVHAHIRSVLESLYNKDVAQQVVIQYGGSVNPENVAELMAKPNIDGALVGGASLKAESFGALLTFNK